MAPPRHLSSYGLRELTKSFPSQFSLVRANVVILRWRKTLLLFGGQNGWRSTVKSTSNTSPCASDTTSPQGQSQSPSVKDMFGRAGSCQWPVSWSSEKTDVFSVPKYYRGKDRTCQKGGAHKTKGTCEGTPPGQLNGLGLELSEKWGLNCTSQRGELMELLWWENPEKLSYLIPSWSRIGGRPHPLTS